MNSATLNKIESASEFLAQFQQLPQYVQEVPPHLDQLHQTALKILDCCSELEACLVPQIAAVAPLPEVPAGMNRETTRQVLTALEGKLVTAEETMQGKAWRLRGQ